MIKNRRVVAVHNSQAHDTRHTPCLEPYFSKLHRCLPRVRSGGGPLVGDHPQVGLTHSKSLTTRPSESTAHIITPLLPKEKKRKQINKSRPPLSLSLLVSRSLRSRRLLRLRHRRPLLLSPRRRRRQPPRGSGGPYPPFCSDGFCEGNVGLPIWSGLWFGLFLAGGSSGWFVCLGFSISLMLVLIDSGGCSVLSTQVENRGGGGFGSKRSRNDGEILGGIPLLLLLPGFG